MNFCAVLDCSNRSNPERDKGYCRIPAIVSRSKPKKQALSVERRATWLARIRREDLVGDATEFYRVCGDHIRYVTVYKVYCSIFAVVSKRTYLSVP